MRIVFDAYWWCEGPLSNQMVQREFISTWLRDFPDDEAVLAVPAAHLGPSNDDLPAAATVVGTTLQPHAVAATLALPLIARRYRADVIVSHNFTPIAGPSVTFIHDVLFQTDPQWFTAAERIYLAPIPLLARRARQVATSSATEAARIRANNPRVRTVTPIGLAVGTRLANCVPQRPAGLPQVDGFVLTVGRLNVRKNLAATIDAALASGQVTPQRPLVIVGEPEGRTATLGPCAERARATASVLFLDRVDDAALKWLYAHADLFIYLSLDEGFGLPPHEALQFGAHVLVSDIPVFRETLAGAAAFVAPTDTTAMAAAIVDCLTNAHAPARPPIEPTDWSSCTRRLRDLAVHAAQRS